MKIDTRDTYVEGQIDDAVTSSFSYGRDPRYVRVVEIGKADSRITEFCGKEERGSYSIRTQGLNEEGAVKTLHDCLDNKLEVEVMQRNSKWAEERRMEGLEETERVGLRQIRTMTDSAAGFGYPIN